MVNPGIVYLVVSSHETGLQSVIHVSSAYLAIPIAHYQRLFAIVLPIIGAANAFYYPRLLFNASQSPARAQQLLPTIIQSLQGILTTVFAVLFFQIAVPGVYLNCGLSTTWQQMFAQKDEASIRQIQESFDCCGFNTPKDRAWPFTGDIQCAQRYGRNTPCIGPWRQATIRNSAIDLGVVLAVGGLQILTLLFVQSASNWRHAWWAQGWRHLSERPIEERERTRPLLTAAATAAVAAVQTDSGDESDVPITYRDLSPQYGTTGDGPRGRPRATAGRIEPSSLRNVWDAE
ncbi:tetraspanin tsp3 [Colletotrichum truncatum]|uniref:Tetraspanin tsp3 n=1 Tax=Colletotrichum truncatum TaxID=5467 RepID=A0ACC3ZB56_COLTU|nr:tetraspanin tsp3 [Colletotrichum truncatum]KAF6783187.1 tetraspanin tsp3 [Colletotrichum truncatum]